MSFAKRFNKVSHNVDTEGFEYRDLKTLHAEQGGDVIHRIDWLFLRTGKYGKHPIFINVENKIMINVPAHLTDTVEDILKDGEAVESIKAGKVAFRIYKYTSHGKDCFGIEFADN